MTGAGAEFSRLVPRGEILRGELEREISANAAERAALARRFGLEALDRLTATLVLRRAGGADLVSVEGRLNAAVTQLCVVTLEPVAAEIDQPVSLLFTLAAPGRASETGAAVEVDPEAADPPEPVGPAGIDLGEAVAEQLGLALDPYPRVPGVELSDVLPPEAESPGEAAPEGPFAALAGLKRGD